MKKKISFILALSLTLTLFTGCNSTNINDGYDEIGTVDSFISSEAYTLSTAEFIDEVTDGTQTSCEVQITADTAALIEAEAGEIESSKVISRSVDADNINATLKWKETKIKETYVVNQACYSRKYPIVGSATVNKYKKGTKVKTIAATDTGYYKIADGEFIHSDYLSEVSTTTTTTAKTTTAKTTSKTTKTTTSVTSYNGYTSEETTTNFKSTIKTTYNIDYKTRYAYKTLNDSEKKFYGDLVYAISNFKKTCAVPSDLLTNDIVKIYGLVYTQEPQLFWMSSTVPQGYGTINLQYIMTDTKKIQADQTKIDTQVAKLMAKVDAQTSTYNKIKLIYDYIVYACESEVSDSGFNSTIYNAILAKGSTQCVGYAKLFNYLCDIAGIESIVITGKNPQGSTHAWNKVYCEDGYYNIDCTWGDPHNAHDSSYIRYVFFLVPDSWIKDSHLQPCTVTRSNGTVVTYFTAPKATKTTYNYFKVTNSTYSTLASAEKALYAELDAAIKARKNTVHIRVDDKAIYTKMMSDSYAKALQKYCKSKDAKVVKIARQKTNMEGTLVVQYDIFYK